MLLKMIMNCNNAGNSNEFIEFMLKAINEAVDGMIVTSNQETTQKTTQEKIIILIKKNPTFIRLDFSLFYFSIYPSIDLEYMSSVIDLYLSPSYSSVNPLYAL